MEGELALFAALSGAVLGWLGLRAAAHRSKGGSGGAHGGHSFPQPPLPLHEVRAMFGLDFSVPQMNHGSFGVTTKEITRARRAFEDEIESHPDTFFRERLLPEFDAACRLVEARFGAEENTCVFVENATTGVNCALRALAARGILVPGATLLFFSSTYNACKNAARDVCKQTGAAAVEARIEFPIESASHAFAQFKQALDRVRPHVVLLDHITSPAAVVLPVRELVRYAKDVLGVAAVILDGAHAPGNCPINLREIDAEYYTGNLHKWLFVPRGTAFLYAKPGPEQSHLLGPVVSHMPNGSLRERFGVVGTNDCTRWRTVPAAFSFVDRVLGGPRALAVHNHLQAAWAAHHLQHAWEPALGRKPRLVAPLDLCASMVCVETPLPLKGLVHGDKADKDSGLNERIGRRLLYSHGVRTMCFFLDDVIWCRVSAQIYVSQRDVERLAAAVLELTHILRQQQSK